MAEKLPNLEKQSDTQVQEPKRIPSKMNQKRSTQDTL